MSNDQQWTNNVLEHLLFLNIESELMSDIDMKSSETLHLLKHLKLFYNFYLFKFE